MFQNLYNQIIYLLFITDVCTLRLDFEAFSIVGLADTIEATGDMCIDTFIGSAVSTGCGTL